MRSATAKPYNQCHRTSVVAQPIRGPERFACDTASVCVCVCVCVCVGGGVLLPFLAPERLVKIFRHYKQARTTADTM